jgi:hypothetical protein
MDKTIHPKDSGDMEPPKGGFDIFISFRDPDLAIALGLAEHLEGRGFNVFMAHKTLKQLGVTDYRRAISEALDQSAALVVVGTRPDYFTSEWVGYEWRSFLNETHSPNKNYGRVFSFTSGVGVDELPYDLRQVQTVKYDPTAPKASFDEMARYIGPREKIRVPRHERKP